MNSFRGNPEYIATLTEIGLESTAEEDRVLALEAANHFDGTHGTSYGGQVLELFMRQQLLSFLDVDEPYPPQAACMQPDWPTGPSAFGSETSRIARMYQAVHQSVGEEIGVKMTIRRLIGNDGDGVPLVADVSNEAIIISSPETMLFPDGTQARLDVSEERPFEAVHEYERKNSGTNLHIGVTALMGSRADSLHVLQLGSLAE